MCHAPPAPSPTSETWRTEVVSPAAVTFSRSMLRRHVGMRCLPAGVDESDVEVLLLAYEELASNAIRHGRLPVHITVTTMDDGWLIDVADDATGCAPAPTIDRDPAQGRLGLHLVARLCRTHGWWTDNTRRHVWARIHPGDRRGATGAGGEGLG